MKGYYSVLLVLIGLMTCCTESQQSISIPVNVFADNYTRLVTDNIYYTVAKSSLSDSVFTYLELKLTPSNQEDIFQLVDRQKVLNAKNFMSFDYGKYLRIEAGGQTSPLTFIQYEETLDPDQAKHFLLGLKIQYSQRTDLNIIIAPNPLNKKKAITIPFILI